MKKYTVSQRTTLTVEPGSVVLLSDEQAKTARIRIAPFACEEEAFTNFLPENENQLPENESVGQGGGTRGRPRKNP